MPQMASIGLVDVTIGGSYLCEGYELRITERCLAEDLACPSEEPFDELAGHEIVTAFVNRRRNTPTNTRRVAPLTSHQTVYRLAYGHRHRGATWHDEANGVVWLLGYAQHEFEDKGDAFPYFKELDAAHRLLPTKADYTALFRDRDRRFTEVVQHEAEQLLDAAREQPGEEQRAVVGGQLGVGVALEVVETLEEVYLAVKTARLTPENLIILFAAFFPERQFDEIDGTHKLPHRELGEEELAFRCLLD
jgi:hypothetical protein